LAPSSSRFPQFWRKAPNWRACVLALGLCERPSGFQRPFRRLCLWPQNSVSWETETGSQRLGSNTELLRRKAEDPVRDHNGQALAYVYFEDEPDI